MDFDQRVLLPRSNVSEKDLCQMISCNPILNKGGFCLKACFDTCPQVCKTLIVDAGDEFSSSNLLPNLFLPPSPPPSLPPPPTDMDYYHPASEQKHLIETSMTITACLIGAGLIFAIIFSIVRFYRRRNDLRMRRSSLPILFDIHQDFLDEDHGPVLDHPIWYIQTVGLPQSVIDSITVCNYRKDEGLVEGTDCSVCLSEFEEDESLRLLPKCCHAFHIPCIDTWLRSHKNCPLCRAPIVCDIASANVSLPDPVSSGSGSRESIEVENLETNGRVGSFGSGIIEVGVTDVNAIPTEGRSGENSTKVLPSSIAGTGSCDPRTVSDLADSRRVAEDDIQPIRRSVSMDSSSALRLYRDVANVIPEEGSSNSRLVHVNKRNSGTVLKHGCSSSSLAKLMRSSSIGFSLQMGPMSMKRPFSSGKKLFSSKHGRSLSSILPL